jgi:YVTN family beta-propeller protein
MGRINAWWCFAVFAGACSNSTSPPPPPTTHPAGNEVIPAPTVGARPFGVAISSKDVALVGRQDVPFLQRTALPTTSFADSVRVGSDPDDIAFNSTGSRAYSTNLAGQTLNVIDIASGVAIDTIPFLSGPVRVLVSPNDATFYVSTAGGTVYAFGAASLTVTHSWALRGVTNGLALSANGATVYASSTGGELYRFNANATGTIDSVSIPGTPQDIALTPNGTALLLANEGGSLEILNPATLALVDTVPGAAGAFGLKPTPDGVQVYATYPSSGRIRIVDLATRSVINTLPVGGVPRRIAFGQAGATALIPNEGGFVTVVH